jgi:RNA polymerase sigma-70 factor (ECF subfamily)
MSRRRPLVADVPDPRPRASNRCRPPRWDSTLKRTLFLLPIDADESLLVEALRAGDADAYRSLYIHHADKVIGLSRMLLPDSLVDDALQETFLRVFGGIDRFRGDARLGTWIHRIAVNVCLNALRRQDVRKRVEAELALIEAETSFDAEAASIDRIAGATLDTLLQQLEPVKRTTFWLYHVEGQTAAEIGEILGEPRATVLKRLQRARVELLNAWRAHEADLPARRGGAR